MDFTTILSTLQNLNTQLSGWISSSRRAQGNLTSRNYVGLGSNFICTGPGRVVSVSVIDCTAGNFGIIFDAVNTDQLDNNHARAWVPDVKGTYPLAIEFKNGLAILVGTDQQACVTYYQGP